MKKFSIAKFNARRDEDFDLWCTRVEAYLVSRSVMDVVHVDMSGVTTDKEKVEKGMAIARSIIIQALGDKPLRTVMAEKKNPFLMWKKLQERYATATATTRVQLMTRLHQMSYNTSKSMSEYVDCMESIFNRLEVMECQVQESMKVAILLASFGDKSLSPYGPVISALETLSDSKLTWDTATSRLLQEYDSKQSHGTGAISPRSTGQRRSASALKAKASVVCYACGKKGHFARDCYSRKNDANGDCSANVANVCTKPKVHFAMMGKDSLPQKTIIDSGASSHMVGVKHFLHGPFSTVKRRVVLGDGRSVFSETSGCAVISCTSRIGQPRSVTLRNVLLVPTLDTNLVSCAELDKSGHEVRFKAGECALKSPGGGEDIVLGTLQSGVYELNGKFSTQERARAAKAIGRHDVAELWHNRLGHVGKSTVQEMIRKGSVRGLKLDTSMQSGTRCEWCLDGKQTRLPLKERSKSASCRGETIHSDVCGPMPVATVGKKLYFVTFIDAWSGFKYVSLMSRKSEVLEKFKQFQAMFERKFDCRIKNLYSDNGGEYEGMLNYLAMKGICVGRSAPYTPEQNGIAERTNRTVMDMARSMLSHGGMSAQFWGEAVATATDICNHVGLRKSGMKTALELLTGTKPFIGHFRTFGCQVMVHVPK